MKRGKSLLLSMPQFSYLYNSKTGQGPFGCKLRLPLIGKHIGNQRVVSKIMRPVSKAVLRTLTDDTYCLNGTDVSGIALSVTVRRPEEAFKESGVFIVFWGSGTRYSI